MIEREQRREVLVKRQHQRAKRQAAWLPAEPPPVTVPHEPAPPLVPPQPAKPDAKPVHPWRRPWSVRRQRELANTV